jgi:hypothetical protein
MNATGEGLFLRRTVFAAALLLGGFLLVSALMRLAARFRRPYARPPSGAEAPQPPPAPGMTRTERPALNLPSLASVRRGKKPPPQPPPAVPAPRIEPNVR